MTPIVGGSLIEPPRPRSPNANRHNYDHWFVREVNSHMTDSARTISITPGSEIDRLLRDTGGGPVELERDGVRYRLSRIAEETSAGLSSEYDPARAIAGMRAAAGSWNDIDADALKAYVYRARDEGTRPLDRP